MKNILILLLTLLSLNAFAKDYAFLFSNNTFIVSDNAFAYSERVARLDNFQIVTQTVDVTIPKEAWVLQAEELFYLGMVTNGFGLPPWTNQTFESVGITLLQKTIYGATEQERNMADRWKGVLESTFKSLIDHHNKYRTQYGETPITAIWDYPLNSTNIYSAQLTNSFILYNNQQYFPK